MDTKMLIPTAAELRRKIEAAKVEDLTPVYAAVEKTITDLCKHINYLIEAPEDYTSHTWFSMEMPNGAWYGDGHGEFLRLLRLKLVPLGYVVEESHDGGGMYDTVVIRWDEKPGKKYYGDASR